jgi:hypothetical protein
MIKCTHHQVIKKVKEVIASLKYLALSYDEVITIDNYLSDSFHCYVVADCYQLPILISLKQVIEGMGSNNLTKVVMGVLKKHGGVFIQMLIEI